MIKYRRVYYDSVKKYALKIGATAIPVVFVLFMLLSQRGDITITGYSGNMTCAGTELDPCYAYINFTANTDIYIYPNENWTFSTNPPVRKVILQRSWGDSWRTINLSKTWNKNVKYAIKFSKGKNYSIRFVGYKYSPYQDIKWSFGSIDPMWYGIKIEKWTRGPSWDKVCSNGKCSKIIHLGIVNYQDENNTWHKINRTITEINKAYSGHNFKYGNEQGVFHSYFHEKYPISTFNFKDYGLIQSPYAIGWYDTNTHNWKVLQTVQQTNAILNNNKITYPNCFYGINISYTYYNTELKEEVIISKRTRDYIRNKYPNILSPENKWFIVANKIKLKNVNMTKNKAIIDQDSTINSRLDFSDIENKTKFFFPLNWAWDEWRNQYMHYADCNKNSTGCFDIKWRIIKYNDDWYVLYGVPLTWFTDKQFPIYIDPTTTYEINESNVNKAYNFPAGGDTPADPGDSNYGEYTSTEYSKIEHDDEDKNEWGDSGSDDWLNLWYNFTINEDISTIISIKVLWNGYDTLTNNDDFEFDIWNHTSGSWYVINQTTSSPGQDTDYGTTFTSGFSDWINSTTGELDLGISGAYGGSGSCPFVYSWDGEKWYFDHEAFPFAVTKSLETTSYEKLEHLKPIDNKLKLQLRERLVEYSYTNFMDIYSVDHPNENSEIMIDLKGNPHTIQNKIKPIKCYSKDGRNCIYDIKDFDNEYYKSDLTQDTTNPENYFDWIEMEFEKPKNANKIKIGTTLMKSYAMTWSWQHFIDNVGKNNFPLMEKVSNLPVIKSIWKNAFHNKIRLKVEIWNGTEWRQVGTIESGRERWTNFLIYTDISNIKTNTLKIRFRATSGFYEINHVFVDYSEDEPMIINKLNMISAIKNNEEDVKENLLINDKKYVELTDITNDLIDLEYENSPKIDNWKKEYFVKIGGYYRFREFTEHQSFYHFLKFTKNVIVPYLFEEGFESRYFMTKYIESLQHHTLYEDYVMVNVTQIDISNITISNCSNLNINNGIYYLDTDIINSSTNYCMNISANNVTLDCRGHTIDGNGTFYGIYAKRDSATETKIIIKNCTITDWTTAGVYLEYANSNTLEKLNLSSNTNRGLYLYYSDSNNITNVTVDSSDYGIFLYNSDSNIIDNTTITSADYGLYFSTAYSNTIKNSKIQDSNTRGLHLYYGASNLIYNNLFNNTNNFGFSGTVGAHYWNTTNQTGTRIYSTGDYIGGNYYTNSTGNGFSDTCPDTSPNDGFCDDYYDVENDASGCTSNNCDYLPLSDEYTTGNPDITYSINSNTGATKIMFVNCSPDWKYYPTYPQYQTDTYGIINATNNGTATGDFQIEYIGTLADGWELWSCNASSTDPKTSSNCILLSTSWQTIWNDVAANEEKNVWLYANCSYVSGNPNVNIDMQAVS